MDDLGKDQVDVSTRVFQVTFLQVCTTDSSSLASNKDAFAGAEQLAYGESTVREMVTFIVIFSPAMVPSVDGMKGLVKSQHGGRGVSVMRSHV